MTDNSIAPWRLIRPREATTATAWEFRHVSDWREISADEHDDLLAAVATVSVLSWETAGMLANGRMTVIVNTHPEPRGVNTHPEPRGVNSKYMEAARDTARRKRRRGRS
jgi:hypothetical protein